MQNVVPVEIVRIRCIRNLKRARVRHRRCRHNDGVVRKGRVGAAAVPCVKGTGGYPPSACDGYVLSPSSIAVFVYDLRVTIFRKMPDEVRIGEKGVVHRNEGALLVGTVVRHTKRVVRVSFVTFVALQAPPTLRRRSGAIRLIFVANAEAVCVFRVRNALYTREAAER